MKLNRRNAVGGFITAMFAGPSVAKSEMQQISKLYPPPTGAESPAIQEATLAADPFYKIKRINRLQKIINGEFEEWQIERLNFDYNHNYNIVQATIDSMKSVSLSYKMHMMQNYNREQQKKRWIKEALNEIKQISMGGGNPT